MDALAQLSEQLCSATVMAEPTDRATLAEIERQLDQISRHLDGLGDATDSAVKDATDTARQLLEKLLAGNADSAQAGFDALCESINELHPLLAQPCSPQSPGKSDEISSTPSTSHIKAEDLPLIAEFIPEAQGHLDSAEAEILKLESNHSDVEAINTIFRSFHTIKGVAGFLNLAQIGALAHAAESMLDQARSGKLAVTSQTVDLILEALDRMKALIAKLDNAARAGHGLESDPSVPALLTKLAASLGTAAADAPQAPLPQQTAPTSGKSPSIAVTPAREIVKVATDRLDNLVNLVGELVIAHSMVSRDVSELVGANKQLSCNIAHLGKIARALQDLSMSLRMVPIQNTFQKMSRLVRDLSHKGGKQIELITSGEETELDRNLVELIEDPLVHMIRNAVDHGIETPQERRDAGKNQIGHVRLHAWHEAGNILLQIADDGRGLDAARIRHKAIEAGLIKHDEPLTEQETFRLIFHAGLSTAPTVTDVSGRGVGMDVVRKNIEALRGRVEIESLPGKGAAFTVRLPLTLALIDGLTARVGGEIYILPLANVEQSIQIRAEQLSIVQGRGEVCLVRDRLLPLYRLHRLFGICGAEQDPTRGVVVIVRDQHQRACLLVDGLLGQQQVVIKALGEVIGSTPAISGGAIMGDGTVSLILDVPGIIDLATRRPQVPPKSNPEGASE